MNWSHHALLAIDLQYDFIESVTDLEPFQTSISGLFEFFRNRMIPIVHVRSFFQPDGSDWMIFGKIRGWTPCVRGTHGADSPVWAAPTAGETVFEKRGFDAFLGTPLQDHLRKRGVKHCFVCGLVTSICVTFSAVSAMQRGFVTTVLSDCVWDDPEEHAFALKHYGGFAYNVTARSSIEEEYSRIEESVTTATTLTQIV